VRILAETRNRKHSKELFKLLREAYDDVQILGYYDSPEDYVAGNLQSAKFESVEEETPFKGNVNIQYNISRRGSVLLPVTEVDKEVEQEQRAKLLSMKLGRCI
jgi:hypothetical protein